MAEEFRMAILTKADLREKYKKKIGRTIPIQKVRLRHFKKEARDLVIRNGLGSFYPDPNNDKEHYTIYRP